MKTVSPKRSFISKTALFVALFVFLGGALSGQELAARVSSLKGKVEVQVGDAWVPLRVGQQINAGTTISTGFKSEAVLSVGESTITVKALSRLTLRELAEQEGLVSTNLYLKVGRVAADVKPVAGKVQAFQVQSPISTASVRGTAFEFDGEKLTVERGLVSFRNQQGTEVDVPIGEAIKTDPNGIGDVADDGDLIAEAVLISTKASNDFGSDNLGQVATVTPTNTPNTADLINDIDFEEVLNEGNQITTVNVTINIEL